MTNGRSLIRSLFASALAACVVSGSSALAQFEITYPDTPKRDDQTLLDWARPPVLDYTIPEDRRGDTSTCGATSEYDLDQTALTCWPVLRAAQLQTLAAYAANETVGGTNANRRKGIAHADEAIAFIGEPQWLLQEYLLIKVLEVKLLALMSLEEWEAAFDTSGQLVSVIQRDLFRFDEFRLGYAYRKRGQSALKLGLYEAAKLNLEDVRRMLTGFNSEKNALPFSNHSEDVIIHAINAGDFAYAEATILAYLEHISQAPRGMQFGKDNHIDLALYLAARTSDNRTALPLIKSRFETQRSYALCDDSFVHFPQILGPLVHDATIKAMLLDSGCSEKSLSVRANERIEVRGGRTLPPFE